MTNTLNAEWASRYASIGFKVFPVAATKKPLTKRGFKDASGDNNKIASWWSAKPSAGIGVATGAVSGIVVLDIDLDKEGALDNLRQLVSTEGEFPQEVVSQTGGGGLHFFFKHPGKGIRVPNAQGLLGYEGVDVRGDGGYVILPPSKHKSGKLYEWGEDQSPFDKSLPECPSFLYIRPEERRPNEDGFAFEGQISEGERNSSLTATAGLLRSMGLPFDQINMVLQAQNQARCHPPLPREEVEAIAQYITRYPPNVNHGQRRTGTGDVGLEELLRFPRTDVGFGRMIAMALNTRIRYNHTRGNWLLWGSHYWEPDQTESIMLEAIDVAMQYNRATELITEDEERAEAGKYARSIQSKARLDAGLVIARAQPGIATTHSQWDRDPDLFAASNGVIDLRTGELRNGRPDDMISISSPIEYDADAKAPLWQKFLRDIFNDDEDVIQFVQRAAGYTLTGHITEQCLFLLVGNGANGKSTFLDTMRGVLGDYSYPAPFSTFERTHGQSGQSNDIAVLVNKRMVMASEPNEGVTLSESRIKSLTGGEEISARFLHQEFFHFHPIMKIWLGVNHLPRVVDDSDGFWRRVRKIDFPARFVAQAEARPGDKVKDLTLAQKLREEMPGIMNWLVEGAVQWYKHGLSVPSTVAAATSTYRQDSDPLHVFITQECVEGTQYEILAEDLFKAYNESCQERMLKNFEILGSTRFHQRIAAKYERNTIDGRSIYVGLALRPTAQRLLNPAGGSGGSIVLRPRKRDEG